MFVNFQKVKILKKSREIIFVNLRLFKCDFKVTLALIVYCTYYKNPYICKLAQLKKSSSSIHIETRSM